MSLRGQTPYSIVSIFLIDFEIIQACFIRTSVQIQRDRLRLTSLDEPAGDLLEFDLVLDGNILGNLPALSVTCLYRSYYTRGLCEIHYAASQVGSVGHKVEQKDLPILDVYRQANFLTVFS